MLLNVIKSMNPLGWFDGNSFNQGTQKWVSKDGKYTIDTTNVGEATSPFTFVYGGTNATLNNIPWPGENKDYTFIHLAKYNGNTRELIWTGTSGTWLSGFYEGGVAFYHNQGHFFNWSSGSSGGFNINASKAGTDWLLSVDMNNFVRVNKGLYQKSISAYSPAGITINTGTYTVSDFAIAEFMIFNRKLSQAEYTQVEEYISKKYGLFGSSIDPSLSEKIYRPIIYEFESHIFTTANKSGENGPTLDDIKKAYSGAFWAQNSNFLNMTKPGIQEWKVPTTGEYTIRAAGAGIPEQTYSKGIDATITTTLTKGEVILILVGQTIRPWGYYTGGAGGTFVVRGTLSSPIPIIISGGGGGRALGFDKITSNATINNNGQIGYYDALGGSNGNGGSNDNTSSPGPGGGGLFTNGALEGGGISFVNGGISGSLGGFGGGGGGTGSERQGTGSSRGSGGGGGYSGGGGGGSKGDSFIHGFVTGGSCGGGGGSYAISTMTNIGTNSGNGFVIITLNTNLCTDANTNQLINKFIEKSKEVDSKELRINELNNELKNKQLQLNENISMINTKEKDLLNIKNTLTLKEADFNKITGAIDALEKQNKEMQESLVKKNELIKNVNDNIKQTQDKLNDYISQRDALNIQLNETKQKTDREIKIAQDNHRNQLAKLTQDEKDARSKLEKDLQEQKKKDVAELTKVYQSRETALEKNFAVLKDSYLKTEEKNKIETKKLLDELEKKKKRI